MNHKNENILLAHGSGGKAMYELIHDIIAPATGMKVFNDSATINIGSYKGHALAFTTDSYVVSPIFFPGGDIGKLAVFGTVNDLAMVGAEPKCLSTGFIIEEGFSMSDFIKVLKSIKEASEEAGVRIVTGDTKVVNKGKGDGIFINTSGIGFVREGINVSPSNIKVGDTVIVSGTIGNHGVAIMAERNGLSFSPPVISDTRPLNGIIAEILKSYNAEIHALRDPTRGGVATTLKEIALESSLCIEIYEEALPVNPQVTGACEILGIDPLYVANEGIFVAFVSSNVAEFIIDILHGHPYGKDARIIGKVLDAPSGKVLLKTRLGGTRLVEMIPGEQLPRIC
jgi:hydrogenase expression/formation protein HypE